MGGAVPPEDEDDEFGYDQSDDDSNLSGDNESESQSDDESGEGGEGGAESDSEDIDGFGGHVSDAFSYGLEYTHVCMHLGWDLRLSGDDEAGEVFAGWVLRIGRSPLMQATVEFLNETSLKAYRTTIPLSIYDSYAPFVTKFKPYALSNNGWKRQHAYAVKYPH
ncbi:hypothetical protein BJ138DRAFT_1115249 [Hygrophoropsis aurantiaca]|uniref:Uncharacterized protein n=1 Tax=Hygrophoropsis aurantiaca TaxID=72124 RepID=A0ACB8A7C0_9AGAM|nr:hypothetical protein BJ138DRAFT_1115249 [Hygrophoropsis aurantiaca]